MNKKSDQESHHFSTQKSKTQTCRDGPTGCHKGYRELIIPSTKLPGVTQGRVGMLIWYTSNLAHAIKVAKTGQFCTL